MARKLKTDEWVQADARGQASNQQEECRSTKQHETRCWHRTVYVPAGMQPIDIIRVYPFEIPFHAGQAGVNKRDVECIASAMVDPNLRWRNMCQFMTAPYEPQATQLSDSFAPEDYAGDQVLLTGHHRFLALLVCGIPLSELPPIQIRIAPMEVPYIFPWSIVEWGA